MALDQIAYKKGYARAKEEGISALLTPEKPDVYSAVWQIPGLDNAHHYFADIKKLAKEKGIGTALSYDFNAFTHRICYAAGVVTRRTEKTAERAADISTQVAVAVPAKTLDTIIWMFKGAAVHPKYIHAQEKLKEAEDDFTHTDELGEMIYYSLQGGYFQAVSDVYIPTKVHLKNVKEAYIHEGIGAAIKTDLVFTFRRLLAPLVILREGIILSLFDFWSREMLSYSISEISDHSIPSHLYKSWWETRSDVRNRLE
jgi:hypothetical protein